MEEEKIIKIEDNGEKKTPKKKKRKRANYTPLLCLICLIVGAIGMYLLVYYVLPKEEGKTVINKSEKEVTVTDAGIGDAVEKLYDAVVVVEVMQNSQLVASGTGFVYKTEGDKAYILTNNHVVSSKDKADIKVMFTNKKEVDVKVEGADEFTDLAVLSVDAKEIISIAEIGNNEQMRLGDTVFTVGAPLDTEYYWTVTRGVLSGKDRMVEISLTQSNSSDYVMKVLQTDASINSGNSGGPLANANGQVIGITNMKLVSSGVEGIGFAIPIEDAVKYAETIIKGETIKRPLLGVTMANLSDRLNLYQQGISLNTELTKGVVAIKIQDGSPAADAGLKRGDIIIAIDDEEVKNIATLRYNLYKHNVGDTITLKIEREGKTQTLKVKLSMTNSAD